MTKPHRRPRETMTIHLGASGASVGPVNHAEAIKDPAAYYKLMGRMKWKLGIHPVQVEKRKARSGKSRKNHHPHG